MNLYVISGVTGMTGNELSRQLVRQGHKVIGFDNFFASSVHTVEDIINNELFVFHEYDINNREEMELLGQEVSGIRGQYGRLVYVNCAAVVHTEHFYHIDRTFTTNVLGMKNFLERSEERRVGKECM